MSFDRVLPKPPTFHHEPAHVPVPRKTSNLLEHKIMNDDAAAAVNMDGDHHRDWASCRYAADMRPVDASPIASLNRAKIALNKIASSASVERSKPIVPLLTKDIPPRDRSSSSSPVKRSANDAVQFCLCQPDPKIPRPRNGEYCPTIYTYSNPDSSAFILYRQHYQSAVVAQNPGLPNPEISKIIGEHWRALPGDTKDEWKALAEVCSSLSLSMARF